MLYDEYFQHEFDESKIRRDKNGRFAKKSSGTNIVTGPRDDSNARIDIAEQIAAIKRKSQTKKSSTKNLVSGPSDYTKGYIDIAEQIAATKRKSQTKKSSTKNLVTGPRDDTNARIDIAKQIAVTKRMTDPKYRKTKTPYVQKVKRILHRLFKREISLNSAVTVIKQTTKDRVNEFMNRKLGTMGRKYLK